MTQTYLLEWLDATVTLNLNPRKNNFKELTAQQSRVIIATAAEQTQIIQAQMTIQVFALTKEKQIKVLIGNYHSSLINLWDNLMLIENTAEFQQSSYQKVISTLFSCLDELLNFMESRFAHFLSLDARMPELYAASLKKKLKKKIDVLSSRPVFHSFNKTASEIVFAELYRFVNSPKNKKITFREILYKKDLIKELENLKLKHNENTIYSDLSEVLIQMNFNSPLYINYFTKLISEKINEFYNLTEKRENLLLFFKELNQIYTNNNVILYKNYPDLKIVMHQWFEQELIFLEKKQELLSDSTAAIPKDQNKALPAPEKTGDKILCQLSADQTALILRASQELKVLVSKSMNHMFKMIVPFLSTANKSTLSYDSMRSKAYSIEERDKEIAIETLQKIIKKIKEY
ncbi:hypothetical protein [Flavobacterium flavigenum]|uniref:hypothetical protein n=1 Tax=Flavobacterium flavigenum TaxID=3003258 RepID=UPI0024828148|nr:hypothetical protein [Flavobacterium flavigenum]